MTADPRDAVVSMGLVLSFAVLVTLHAAVLFGLARQRRFLGTVAGLLLPPVAPVWAFRCGMRWRSVAWGFAVVAYVAFFALAR
jgi:hypothetical protein